MISVLADNLNKKRVTGIDVFSGCGGFSLGFMRAGINVVGAVEIDSGAACTYVYNLADSSCEMHFVEEENKTNWEKFLEGENRRAREIKRENGYDFSFEFGKGWISRNPQIAGVKHFWLGDIQKISGKEMLDVLGVEKGKIDCLFGGPPCQGFTITNPNRSTEDARSKLMWQFIRLVREIQPRYFVIENVPGLLTYKDFFKLLMMSLEQCGYTVRFNLLDACSYGVPQRRLRVLIEGGRNDTKIIPTFPTPEYFDTDRIGKGSIPAPLVAKKCFAVHGFTRDEVCDVWVNSKLNIAMNKKTAAEKVEQAVNEILVEMIVKLAEIKNVKVGKNNSGSIKNHK